MADKKISALTALSAANLAPAADVLPIVDATGPETKKITAADVVNGVLNAATAVGIGTAGPTSKLDVVGGNGDSITFRTGTRSIGIGQISSQASVFWGSSTDLTFFSGSELARLTGGGNLGIGTASPTARLQVKSSAAQVLNIEGTQARGSGGVFAAFLDPTGRKGYFGYATSVDDGLLIANEMNAYMAFHTNATERMRITAVGNIVAGAQAALATTATNGFLYVPTCAGTPTGTPTAITGMAPIVVNTTNNKLYFYSGGAWRDAGP